MKKLLILAISFYRRNISPLRQPCCRFSPTCSAYALEAIEKYGALRGGWLAIRRLLKCHPFHKGGYDPVPEFLPGDISLKNSHDCAKNWGNANVDNN